MSLSMTDQLNSTDTDDRLWSYLARRQSGAPRATEAWPQPRFSEYGETVTDHLTGLIWSKNAAPTGFPLTWWEALTYIDGMNSRQVYGYTDWRLPNRKELFSLVSHAKKNPSLPEGHPFINVFSGYYWTATTCSRLPRQAWYVHLGGARVFKGMKHGSYMVWPVRNGCEGLVALPRSGQRACYDEIGHVIPCNHLRQDGALQIGSPWPEPRFVKSGQSFLDKLTGLTWSPKASGASDMVDWVSALKMIQTMNADKTFGCSDWRLPNIRELESLADMGSHSPALPAGHPFKEVQRYYWSSTTSAYDPGYAWVLYLEDGAVGVGYKKQSDFFVWAVYGGSRRQCLSI